MTLIIEQHSPPKAAGRRAFAVGFMPRVKVEIRHYLCDHLGTPNALIREDSPLDWAVQLDAWGNVRAEHNPGELYQPIRLPGQHKDNDSGLSYNRYRYYEQGISSYTTQDPIGLEGGGNLYKYPVNPMSRIDPMGLQGWQSIPMFNGNLPGNQQALSRAMNPTPSSPGGWAVSGEVGIAAKGGIGGRRQ